jgi:hypothetical protein
LTLTNCKSPLHNNNKKWCRKLRYLDLKYILI